MVLFDKREMSLIYIIMVHATSGCNHTIVQWCVPLTHYTNKIHFGKFEKKTQHGLTVDDI